MFSISLALLLIYFDQVLMVASDTGRATSDGICLTKSCILTAAKLLESVDMNADPCEDFYQYACGGWLDDVEIPDDKSSYGTTEMLQDKLHRSMKRILELKSEKLDDNSEAVKKLVNIYRACMNEAQIERVGLQPFLEFLAKITPWPAVGIGANEFNDTAFDLVNALSSSSKYASSNSLIAVSVASDPKNSSRHIVQLDQAALGMPSRDYFLKEANDTVLRAYLRFMTSVGKVFLLAQHGMNLSDVRISTFENEMAELLQFEIKLASVMTPNEDRRDPNKMYNLMTVAELARTVPEFDWLRFLQATFADVNITVDETEVVNVVEPKYLTKLTDLVHRTPCRTLANYLAWRAAGDAVEELSKNLQKIATEFAGVLIGVAKQKSRWETCIEAPSSASSLDMVVARLYVEKHFDKESKALAIEMMTGIQQAFVQLLAEHDWMEAKEIEMAKQKISTMAKLIAYPDKLLNDSWLNERYAEYVGLNDQHFQNYVQNNVAHIRYNMKKLRQPVDRLEFIGSPAEINAYYDQALNVIAFLAAIMQPPYFQPNQPMSLNFGGIGSMMGHELTHGFDDEGRHYDADGKLNDWWSEKTADNYDDKTQCLVDQFNNFTINGGSLDGMRLNGITTQGENIADLGGLRQSYHAYKNWLTQQPQILNQTTPVMISEQQRLPGLSNYSDDQLFFLGYAISWCSKQRPEASKLQILSDEHAPDKYRIIGPLINTPEFALAFSCPVGSPMNPEKKCRVW